VKLPEREKAVIPEPKLRDYLLSSSHPHGRHKAVFFGRFGFTRERWQELASALRAHADIHEVGRVEETPFGTRYTVEGDLTTPVGRVVRVRTVWYVERGEDFPRFVTAYPLEVRR
jgi:hypothetical protein